MMQEALKKEAYVRGKLKHPLISEIRGKGLMLCAITNSAQTTNRVVTTAIEKGLILFWLLYEPKAIRITPPLTISMQALEKGCDTILEILDDIYINC